MLCTRFRTIIHISKKCPYGYMGKSMKLLTFVWLFFLNKFTAAHAEHIKETGYNIFNFYVENQSCTQYKCALHRAVRGTLIWITRLFFYAKIKDFYYPVPYMCLARHLNSSSKLLKKIVTQKLKVSWTCSYVYDFFSKGG